MTDWVGLNQQDSSPIASVILNQGNGTFSPAVSFSFGSSAVPVVGPFTTADVNGDGNTDLIAGGISYDNFGVLYGRGDGTFSAPQTIGLPGVGLFYSASVADFNHDGRNDIVSFSDGGANIFLQQSNGTFSFAYTVGIIDNSQSNYSVKDMNGDGLPDLLSDRLGGQIQIGLNNGDGSFSVTVTNNTGDQHLLADVTGDGLPDFIDLTTLTVNANQGDGTFALTSTIFTGTETVNGALAEAADLNGDGLLDLFAAADDSSVGGTGARGVNIWLNQGGGRFSSRSFYDIGGGSSATSLAAADFNRDGTLDIVGAGNKNVTAFILKSSSSGYTNSVLSTTQSFGVEDLSVTDLDHDGHPDLVSRTGGAISFFQGQGDGTFGLDGSRATQRLIFGDARGMVQINHIDVSTQLQAKKSMSVLDARLERLNKQQGVFGAVRSRLETASRVISTTAVTYRSAESRIMDTDIAQDAAEQTRLTIVQRAASAVLAQANLQPEIALKLLHT